MAIHWTVQLVLAYHVVYRVANAPHGALNSICTVEARTNRTAGDLRHVDDQTPDERIQQVRVSEIRREPRPCSWLYPRHDDAYLRHCQADQVL